MSAIVEFLFISLGYLNPNVINTNNITKSSTLDNSYKRLDIWNQWRRQLWGTGARVPPRLPTISFLVHFGVNLTASYPNIARYLVQMSTNHSSFDQYCISYETISHRAAAAPSPEVRHECPMTVISSYAPPLNKSWQRHCSWAFKASA